MSEVGRYCCFTCPEYDQAPKRLDDACPTCGQAYGFPLEQVPQRIGNFDVVRSIGRGFYAATYVARPRSGLNRTPRVLKVSPAALYEKFGKNFAEEMERHAAVAVGADHVVEAEDIFDDVVDFDGLELPCHVAVLQFVEGETLAKHLRADGNLSASQAAQIACDLFRMREEFERQQVHHNDLHAANIIIQELPMGRRRADAIEPAIRAVAIDLGSVAEDRRSGGDYKGDLHWIGQHINDLAERLLARGDAAPDLDRRVGLQLQIIAQSIASVTENQRTPAADDMIKIIREQYHRTAEPWRPWRNQAVLRTFAASYNAQTLDAWYVPQLLVDPGGTWLHRVGAPGPLVMTGMRGCGKTMLLQSIQFHARATVLPEETDAEALARIKEDGYVGLFVSAQRLIPVDPKASRPSMEELLARLLVAYAVQAARAMAHLEDIEPGLLAFDAGASLVRAVAETLEPRPEIAATSTVEQLERAMSDLLIRVSRNNSGIRLATNPNIAFPLLSNAVRHASPIWQDAQVLFLLDDVSTRYLDAERIEDLLSSLLFQHTDCAFKLTSEAQTIFLSLKSPGKVHPAAAGRDFATFDLGADVQNRLKDRSAKTFLNDILDARARLFPGHPKQSSAQVLGDVDLETIARTIVETQSQNRSRERKRLYHGVRALAGVCVGDIGTVIQIYQEMLAGIQLSLPISPERQHEVFRDFCARHLYHLDRRHSDLKSVALQFAEASHHLLVESGKGKPTGRIRQYTSLYVRVTTGDVQAQMTRLRELVDAGVFVFTGGTARTKTHDSDPVQQFKLTFRKIYGLANFIGLSDRDRFELSGDDLERWLNQPALGRDILLRNLSKSSIEDDAEESDIGGLDAPSRGLGTARNRQTALTEFFPPSDPTDAPLSPLPESATTPPEVTELGERDLEGLEVEDLVLGLGFEERAPESLRRILDLVAPSRVVAVRYAVDGNAGAILDLLQERGVPVKEVLYEQINQDGAALDLRGTTLVDLTGLAKPALFHAVRAGLSTFSPLLLSYTSALQYYPLEEELQQVLDAAESEDEHLLLSALRGVLTGESGPYESVPLSAAVSDGTRLRALSAFASPRHERLLHLAGEREFDALEIMTDKAETSRARVGTIAARIALEETPRGTVLPVDAKNLSEVVGHLVRQHQDWFVRGGLDYEIGLTGSKLQAAAAAIVAAVLPVNQVWYVRPKHFDETHFSSGVGVTRHFRVAQATGLYVRQQERPQEG
ncbi:hypothetical protein GCM10007913_33840 [Devosia yakushimensis]|uniref:Protein kinase domain-containing protein n=1 Tax=Devosia yakushimensis TaxID=470028 RepID=A0ABQ5UHA5_9HYPH|nr:hypothetical protein [Devosia yakushimensis]GLQ11452.1 hypothetical protein GCM10007913_33840 [Devosia yakushimensis]